ncbi:MAG: ribose-5-phosphate isomerase RpiA [Silicimonas sp.]|nr:ribose-5-phosphate isomerase RpiA [Silicimonas sp.]MBT8423342.1 ribose-5-phosphate isomerase RpiA [Silicimonas sp.]NNL35201.1 ribose-5-phosphate isomerase RpiA [Silicimonas sp.]NNL72782.1 ribose-5-phosphate isomerase RpiA [Silicimonas sp.]
MSEPLSPIEIAKFAAAKRAAAFVEEGMQVGLGTGSTAAWLVKCLAERMKSEGLKFTGVPTSTTTAELATELGVPITTLDEARWLDLTIDGADEYDRELNLIKGGGGALLQEKIVATASDRMIVITDATKKVETLGAFPLPVEVVPFGMNTTKRLLEEMLEGLEVMGNTGKFRVKGDQLFVTDEGNHIIDLHLGRIGNARQLSLILNQVPGVVENGLFIDICDVIVTGHGDGKVEVRDINSGESETTLVTSAQDDNVFLDIAD